MALQFHSEFTYSDMESSRVTPLHAPTVAVQHPGGFLWALGTCLAWVWVRGIGYFQGQLFTSEKQGWGDKYSCFGRHVASDGLILRSVVYDNLEVMLYWTQMASEVICS